MTAFAGESQARNKYTYFASVAKKEGYEQIAAIFEQTANNEKEHAKLWFKALHNGGCVVATVTANCAGNKGIFTNGGHYIALMAADENDEITVLDPSWTSKKYKKWVKEGIVREEGSIVYAAADVVHAERNPRWTTYFIFRRKKGNYKA